MQKVYTRIDLWYTSLKYCLPVSVELLICVLFIRLFFDFPNYLLPFILTDRSIDLFQSYHELSESIGWILSLLGEKLWWHICLSLARNHCAKAVPRKSSLYNWSSLWFCMVNKMRASRVNWSFCLPLQGPVSSPLNSLQIRAAISRYEEASLLFDEANYLSSSCENNYCFARTSPELIYYYKRLWLEEEEGGEIL